MKTLAKAIIQALAFLELSDEDHVNPAAALRAMDVIRATLSGCSAEERKVLETVLRQERREMKAAGAAADLLEFYDDFLDTYGLRED